MPISRAATLGGPLRVVLEVVEVEQRDVVDLATPGSTSRGSATSRISSGRPLRHAITISTVARSTRTSVDAVEENSTSTSTSVSAMSASGIASAADVARRASPRALGVRLATSTSVDAARAQRRREAATHLPGADHEHARALERSELLGRDRDRGRRDRHRMTADAGLGADALARLDRVPEQLRQQLGRAAFAHRGLPRVADLAEDLALADDHRVEAGRDREEVRDRGVVVVRVEVIGEVVGVGAGVRGEELARRRRPQRGSACSARRSRCGCTSRARPPRAGAHVRSDRAAPSGSAIVRDRHPLEQLDGNGAVVQADDDERHVLKSSFASSMRPARTSSTMPERNACCQSASSLERPEARSASRASESRSSRVSYSGPISSFELAPEVRGERRAAAAGADRDARDRNAGPPTSA